MHCQNVKVVTMDQSEIEIEDSENGSGEFDYQSADEAEGDKDEPLMEFKVDPDQILGGGYDYQSAEEEEGEHLMEFKVDPDLSTSRVLRERKIKKESPPKSKNTKPSVKRDWTCPLTHCSGRLGGFKTRP